MESSSDQERFAAAQHSAALSQQNLKQRQIALNSPTCIRPVKNFLPMDVVCGGARDSTGASQLHCVFSLVKGRRVASLILLTVQLQASSISL